VDISDQQLEEHDKYAWRGRPKQSIRDLVPRQTSSSAKAFFFAQTQIPGGTQGLCTQGHGKREQAGPACCCTRCGWGWGTPALKGGV
jgi:hypothetical protein